MKIKVMSGKKFTFIDSTKQINHSQFQKSFFNETINAQTKELPRYYFAINSKGELDITGELKIVAF